MTEQPETGCRVFVGPEVSIELSDTLDSMDLELTSLEQADVVVWNDSNPASFPPALPTTVKWVQLPAAGVERWLEAGIIDRDRIWTSMSGAYAKTVAEHALAMLLAGVRGIARIAAWREWRRAESFEYVHSLAGATVAIVGAGAIGQALIGSLSTLGAKCIAVTRSGRPVTGAECCSVAQLDTVLARSDHVVLAAPATPASFHLIGTAQFDLLQPHTWLVNVGRGALVDQDALVAAISDGRIAGAALDVTDPEPLPSDHQLWSYPNIIITPHAANPPKLLQREMIRRIQENLTQWISDQPLIGVIDLDAQY